MDAIKAFLKKNKISYATIVYRGQEEPVLLSDILESYAKGLQPGIPSDEEIEKIAEMLWASTVPSNGGQFKRVFTKWMRDQLTTSSNESESNKPHCWGKMTWILKYESGKEPSNSICSCAFGSKECLRLTRENAPKPPLVK